MSRERLRLLDGFAATGSSSLLPSLWWVAPD